MIYLLDTNIIIFFFKGRYDIAERMDNIGVENCFLSEISLAELKYGALYSQKPEKHNLEIENLLKVVGVIPITTAIDLFAEEKARLRKAGKMIDDFDLFIGCTAIVNNLTLVTNNIKHFERLQNLKIEDWTK